MDFCPHGIRALTRRLKARSVLDIVAWHYTIRIPMSRTRGKLRKDDQSCKSVTRQSFGVGSKYCIMRPGITILARAQ